MASGVLVLALVYLGASCQHHTGWKATQYFQLLVEVSFGNIAAVDKSLSSSLTDARDAMINAVVDMLSSYRASQSGSNQFAGQLPCPYQLRLIPLYVLAMLKSVRHTVLNNFTSISRLIGRLYWECCICCTSVVEMNTYHSELDWQFS